MLDLTLVTVVAELNAYLVAKLELEADPVIISDVPDTPIEDDDPGSLRVTLIRIEEDKLAIQKQHQSKDPKAVYLDLYVLISASFPLASNTDALKFISEVVVFFGKKPHFEAENTPGLEAGLELDFEIHNVTFQEQSDLWRLVGAKSRPAVLYKVYGLRIVTEDE